MHVHAHVCACAVDAMTLEGSAGPSKRGERVEVASAFSLPISAFGPYTPHTASKGCDPAKPDKWAFGTCTLLGAGAASGKLAPAGEGDAQLSRGCRV